MNFLLIGFVLLMWDVNPENSLSKVTGYTIFYGTESGVYTDSIDVGDVRQVEISVNAKTYFVVAAFNANPGHSPISEEVYYDPALSVDDESPTAELAVYPNPFKQTVNFTGHGTVAIYNEIGQFVVLVNEFWDSGGFASGIYICVSKVGNFKITKL